MVFNVRLSMANFDKRPNRNCLLIADTILVLDKLPVDVLTKGNPKAYADISYSIDENDEDIPEEEKAAGVPNSKK